MKQHKVKNALPRITGLLLFLMLLSYSLAFAQLNQNCTVSVLNRTAQVKADGSWVIPNVPSNMGKVRVRATCVENGITRSGQSDWVTIPPNGSIKVGDISLDVFDPAPSSVNISAPSTTLTTLGSTAQLTVTATYPGGSTRNITQGSAGTVYRSTNPAIATVSDNGLVTATGTGRVIISASSEMVLSSLLFTVTQSNNNDVDNDGIPDDWELANGLNPNDPIDAMEDPDHDGLTNKQEYDLGTDIHVADTDGDGLSDGAEVNQYHANPLLADSDGDGIKDGLEVQTGSDPRNAGSVNLARALARLEVTPSNFVLIFNTIMSEASRQLTVTGVLTDGTRLDLTSNTRGTNYNSSDLAVANFGAADGLVFAGQNGVAVITVSNSGFSTTARATIRTFSPTALSYVGIPTPGYANNVDVSGGYAYVAGGSGGLYVVNVSDSLHPVIVGAVDTPGNANDVRVNGNMSYIADGASGLQIVDVSNPAAPVIIGAVNTPGDAWDVVVNGNYAYVADGASGLQIINISNPASPTIAGSLDTPGTAKGIDVTGNLAVVADSYSGIRVIDVTDPAHPVSLGSVNTGGDAVDLAISGSTAYVVQYTSGLRAVDISNPSAPAVIGSETVGGYLFDIATWGNFAFSADVVRVNAVPIHDITTPNNPIFRAVLDFSGFRDDNGTGIAVTPNYLYLTASRDIQENGTTGFGNGYTRLYIGQYAEIVDSGTTPPTVSITSPLNGAEVIEGSTLPISVSATDDVLVASVNILVDGEVNTTNNTAPYQFNYQVPMGITSLAVGATALDLANNTGTARTAFVSVLPDPPPVVIITSPADGAVFIENSAIAISATATDNTSVTKVEFLVNGEVVATDVTSPYQYNYSLPIGLTGAVVIGARATDTAGKVGYAANVTVNVNPDPPPTISITGPTSGTTVIEGTTMTISATATDNVSVASVKFSVNGTVIATDTTNPYQASYLVPIGATGLTLGASATDNLGKVGIADNVNVLVVPDPGTTVIGTVVDIASQPVEGATVSTVGGMNAVTLADGSFSISRVPTAQGNITVNAVAVINGKTLSGNSALLPSVAGGITDVGQIVIRSGYNVLLLSDSDNNATTALADTLSAAGNMVTLRPAPEYTWDATNPLLTGYDCVIHLDGSTYSNPLPAQAQTALEYFVRNGGGYIGSQWNGYERYNRYQTGMDNLILQVWPGPNNCGSCNNTWEIVPGQEGHPLLSGIPNSFTFYADGHSDGTQVVFDVNPSIVLMRTPGGAGPAVLIREYGSGRVVNFAHAANYQTHQTLLDPNIQQLYVNAVNWASSNSVVLNRTTVTGMVVDNNANPVAGAVVSVGRIIQTTNADGRFSMNMYTTGDITVSAYAFTGGAFYSGTSSAVTPVNNGITDVGTIVITPLNLGQAFKETFGTGFNSGQWFFGGSALHDSTNENLLIAPVTGGLGRAFYLTPYMADSFHAEFDYDIWGGDGADGLTFAWVQDYNYPESGGGSLNFDGANGFAVEFDTWPWNSGDTGARHIGLLRNYTSNHLTTFDTETRGTHHVSINFAFGTIHVFFDGTEVINYTIPGYVPFNAYFGFTAATGGSTDNHVIDNFILNVGSLVN